MDNFKIPFVTNATLQRYENAIKQLKRKQAKLYLKVNANSGFGKGLWRYTADSSQVRPTTIQKN